MPWLEALAIASLSLGGLSAVWIVGDLAAGNRQHMWIMNVVWPITALYFGPLALWGYYRWGRLSSHRRMMDALHRGEEPPGKRKSFAAMCAIGATHCGSGCALGDLAAEWGLVAFPLVLFGHRLFAAWIVDYILAFIFGIAFQYFTIKPMRNLSAGAGLAAALKADALSLTAWQLGMYGGMAIATFGIFHRELEQTDPVFWFVMQLAMVFGFLVSYPVNWWLLRSGLKEKM